MLHERVKNFRLKCFKLFCIMIYSTLKMYFRFLMLHVLSKGNITLFRIRKALHHLHNVS